MKINKKAQSEFATFFVILFAIGLIIAVVFAFIFLHDNNVTMPTKIQPIENISGGIDADYILYPNREFVTGDILERNKTIICQSGYSASVRDVSLSLRKRVFARDGIEYPQPRGTYELDHWIALEIGGSNDESNLFVQFEPYYKWKDSIENLVHRKLCSTNMSVETATSLMWIWYDIYRNKSIINDYVY